MSDSKFKDVIAALHKKREESGIDKGGKKYSMVKDRIEVFRMEFGATYGIHTDIDYGRGFNPGSVIVAKAHITTQDGTVMASGHAMTFVGMDEVSTTSAIEAVETSAIGRALACFGLHGGEYASDQEMQALPYKAQMAAETPPPNSQMIPDPVRQYREQQNSLPPDRRDTIRGFVPEYIDNIDEIDVGVACNKIADHLGIIQTDAELSAYWHDLKHFRGDLEEFDPQLFAELVQAFTATKRMIIGESK